MMLRYIVLFFVAATLSCTPSGKTSNPSNDLDQPQVLINFDSLLATLDITLPQPSAPVANYVNIRQAGNILYLAGKGSRREDGSIWSGKIGENMTTEEGYQAARSIGIQHLGVLQNHLGDLNKIKQLLKVTGMVNAVPNFTDQPEVINGYSDIMVQVLGDKGKHARAAVGMGSLPRGLAVEIDLIVEIYE